MNVGETIDVSIVIPTYNRRGTVLRALMSGLASSPACRVEVLVVDDGSEDGTREALAEELGQPSGDQLDQDECRWDAEAGARVVYIRRGHAGANPARNTGLGLACGTYVKFLDSDDELLSGVLPREVAHADETGADVVVTGWEERQAGSEGDGAEVCVSIPAPSLENGIDDMLLGRSPWTAAALYRRQSIASLRWDPDCDKAQDWDWAWTVCLSGARFVRLDLLSAVYRHGAARRVSSDGDAFLRATRARQRILRKVEDNLRETGRLTDARARSLVQYYYKDARVIAESDGQEWRAMWRHCLELAPGFVPRETQPLARWCNRICGTCAGVRAFVALRAMARALGLAR